MRMTPTDRSITERLNAKHAGFASKAANATPSNIARAALEHLLDQDVGDSVSLSWIASRLTDKTVLATDIPRATLSEARGELDRLTAASRFGIADDPLNTGFVRLVDRDASVNEID